MREKGRRTARPADAITGVWMASDILKFELDSRHGHNQYWTFYPGLSIVSVMLILQENNVTRSEVVVIRRTGGEGKGSACFS